MPGVAPDPAVSLATTSELVVTEEDPAAEDVSPDTTSKAKKFLKKSQKNSLRLMSSLMRLMPEADPDTAERDAEPSEEADTGEDLAPRDA